MRIRSRWASSLALLLVVVVACSASSCGSAAPDTAAAPQPPVNKALNLAGNWAGMESDRLGSARLTWTLAQSGDSVFGNATIRPVDATDGSCASCHKLKDGKVSGSISGAMLKLVMSFPAGGKDPTPLCSITLSSDSAMVSTAAVVGTYHGADPCEGIFDGTLSMTRDP